MSASSSLRLVSAENDVPRWRSSSSLILEGEKQGLKVTAHGGRVLRDTDNMGTQQESVILCTAGGKHMRCQYNKYKQANCWPAEIPGPYLHLSQLTFKEFLFSFVFKLYVVYKAQRILEDVPLKPLLQAPAPRGTRPPAGPLVHPCQRVLHLLVLAPFL